MLAAAAAAIHQPFGCPARRGSASRRRLDDRSGRNRKVQLIIAANDPTTTFVGWRLSFAVTAIMTATVAHATPGIHTDLRLKGAAET